MEKNLLLEIGTEEVPARFISGALENLKLLAYERFKQSRLTFQEIKTLGTPRRLALLASGISPSQTDLEENIIGPPKNKAFSEDGHPTPVAQGFAKAKSVPVSALEFIETPKGIYLCLKKKTPGLPAARVLSEILPQLISDLPFPKYMRWGNTPFRFARPIHWIVALLGEKVIPFSLGGIQSGNKTFGHRFMSPEAISLTDGEDYISKLRRAYVLVDPLEREEILKSSIKSVAREIGGEVLADPELIQEVNYLVEFPVSVYGGFEPDFLQLPSEVLITSMK
jgi:glycyl-tRNA synthetase beta chain